MTKKIFITATGTDVGKTYVSALIIKKMRESGFNCGYYKPVMSGVTELGKRLVDSDANYIIRIADLEETAENCVSYWWKEAVSPHLDKKELEKKLISTKSKMIFMKFQKNMIIYWLKVLEE